ncbi:MAG: hypothetical protein JSU07_10145 [Bacteroidetes bacterium]|nr:hypothetical protein [Bacteroidota bacterium]
MEKQKSDILFEEKQYLGQNRLSIFIRLILALFCFLGYYWSENPKPVEVGRIKIGSYPIEYSESGIIFFVVGVCVLLISSVLVFVLHTHTKIYKDYILLDGYFHSRRVKISINGLKSLRKGKYKKSLFRTSVYNLHNNGIIRFYTYGEDFIELTDDADFTYRIGSQKINELYRVLNQQISKTT